VESDFDNAYLGCAGSTNEWALVAHNPESIHVLDSSLSQDRMKGFYFSGFNFEFEIEPEQVFFMNTYIYVGATAPDSMNRLVLFRMPSNGSTVLVTRTTSFAIWAMAFIGQASTYAVMLADYAPNSANINSLGAFYFTADLQSFNAKKVFTRFNSKYKFTHAVICGTFDICTCYYDYTGFLEGGVMRFPGLGTSAEYSGSKFSHTFG